MFLWECPAPLTGCWWCACPFCCFRARSRSRFCSWNRKSLDCRRFCEIVRFGVIFLRVLCGDYPKEWNAPFGKIYTTHSLFLPFLYYRSPCVYQGFLFSLDTLRMSLWWVCLFWGGWSSHLVISWWSCIGIPRRCAAAIFWSAINCSARFWAETPVEFWWGRLIGAIIGRRRRNRKGIIACAL